MTLIEAMKLALAALEEIALAGMSGTGMESDEAMTAWHARQAWKFIGIAARQLAALRQAIEQAEQAQPVAKIRTWHRNGMQHAELMDWGAEIESLPDGEYELHTAPPPRQPLTDEQAEKQEPADKNGSPCPEFWDWLPKAYNFDGDGVFTKYNMEVAFLAGKQSVASIDTSEKRVDEIQKQRHEQAQKQELVACRYGDNGYACCEGRPCEADEHNARLAQKQEPVAWVVYSSAENDIVWFDPGKRLKQNTPLYTSPPPRQPLTDEQLQNLMDDLEVGGGIAKEFARAIEAAHGITGEKHG